MSWFYNESVIEEIDPKFVGFVYVIINKTNNKQYIGKKILKFKKTKTVKGKKKRIYVESDWRTYWSSSTELKEIVALLGEQQFERKILRFCKSKAECSYFELKYQMEYDVLLKQNLWYNKWVSCKLNARTLTKVEL